jgi:glycosyltransferase involved in cell wall biosynthesis
MPCHHPEISVVITCYREGLLLREAVESIRQQTCSPGEIVIVNDASPDKTTNQVCQKLEAEADIQVIWQAKNGGPSVARNAGFAAARGSILVPLDADDLLPPDALKHIHQAFEQHPDAGFIHGSYIRQDRPGHDQLIPAEPISLSTLLRPKKFSMSTNWTLIGTAPLKKWLWGKVGHGDPTLGAEDLHDLEFWIRAMALPCNFYGTSEVIYIWRKYLGSNSRQVNPMSWYRIAHKHLDVYRQNGIEYRAFELLLLGSKWTGDAAAIRYYRQALWQCLQQGNFQLSTLITLLVPGYLFRPLARIAGKFR